MELTLEERFEWLKNNEPKGWKCPDRHNPPINWESNSSVIFE